MVKDVEELGAELYPRLFRQLVVLERGEIDSLDPGTVERVSSRVAHQCPARDRRRRREAGRIEGQQLSGGISRHARRGVASGHKIGKIHGKITIKSGLQRVPAATDCDCVGGAASESHDGAQLPSAQYLLRDSRLWAGYVPNESADGGVANIEVTGSDPVLLAEE